MGVGATLVVALDWAVQDPPLHLAMPHEIREILDFY
jgi:hypothetical protein